MTDQTPCTCCATCRHYKPVRQHSYGERYDGVCMRQHLRVYEADNARCTRWEVRRDGR